jgi:hypothetical protein
VQQAPYLTLRVVRLPSGLSRREFPKATFKPHSHLILSTKQPENEK